MNALGLRVPHGAGEGLPSHTSRLAYWNGCSSMGEFCLDMGIYARDVVQGDPAAIERVAELAALDPDELGRMTIRKLEGVTEYELAGQSIDKLNLRRDHMRICPLCLREDFERWPELEDAAPYVRTEWCLRQFHACPDHQILLVHVQAEEVHDFTRAFVTTRWKTEDWFSNLVVSPPTGLETYLRNRLRGEEVEPHWLDQFPWDRAAKLAEIVGAAILWGRSFSIRKLPCNQWQKAGAAGFQALSGGEEGLRQFLTDFIDKYGRYDARCAGPEGLLGKFFFWLNQESDDPAYAPVIEVVSEFVQDMLPLAPGDLVLGKPVGVRRYYSLPALCEKTKIPRRRLRQLLIGSGMIKGQESLADGSVLIRADDAAAFLTDIDVPIQMKEAEVYLNAHRPNTQKLYRAGFIKSVPMAATGLKTVAFAKRDLDAFVESLLGDAPDVGADEIDFFPITRVASKRRCHIEKLVAMILDGKVTAIRRDPGVRGLISVLVNGAVIDQAIGREERPGLSIKDARGILRTSGDTVRALIRVGAIRTTAFFHPRTEKTIQTISSEELAGFQKRFVSFADLRTRHGITFTAMRQKMESAGLEPCFDPEVVPTRYYLRTDCPE